MTTNEQVLIPVLLPPTAGPLRLAAAAYLARFKGQSRIHTESDLRAFLTWCQQRGLEPLAAQRPHVELYVRWMQEVQRFKPSTVSRRMAVVAGFYRTCVIDEVLPHSPAEYVRRPNVPPGVTNPWTDTSSVRGHADRRPAIQQHPRLRLGRDAGASRFADL